MTAFASFLVGFGIVFALVGIEQRMRADRTLRQAERRMRQVDAAANEIGGSLREWALLVHEMSRANAELAADNDRLRYGRPELTAVPGAVRFTPEGRYVPTGFSLN